MTHTKIIVNLFDPTLVDVIDINKKEIEIEDDLLLLKDHATTWNKETIVISIFNHSNA